MQPDNISGLLPEDMMRESRSVSTESFTNYQPINSSCFDASNSEENVFTCKIISPFHLCCYFVWLISICILDEGFFAYSSDIELKYLYLCCFKTFHSSFHRSSWITWRDLCFCFCFCAFWQVPFIFLNRLKQKGKKRFIKNGKHAQHEQHVNAWSKKISSWVFTIFANTVRKPIPSAAAPELACLEYESSSVQQIQRTTATCNGKPRQSSARRQVWTEAKVNE